MAYIDALTMLSGSVNPATNALSGQSLSGSSPVMSTNVVDLSASRDLRGSNWQFQVTQAFAGATSVELQLVTADDAAMSTNLTVRASTGPLPVAQLTAGARFIAEMNSDLTKNGQRYIAARYVPVGTISAGALLCSVVGDVSDPTKPNVFQTSYSVI